MAHEEVREACRGKQHPTMAPKMVQEGMEASEESSWATQRPLREPLDPRGAKGAQEDAKMAQESLETGLKNRKCEKPKHEEAISSHL